MDLSSLYTTPGSNRKPRRVGRGESSGSGKTAGKGTKGQMSRKGHKRKVNFEGGQMPLLRRLPKRGFKNPARVAYTAVNLESLNGFEDGSVVDAAALMSKGIVKKFANGGFKVLSGGEYGRKLTVKANAFSAAAKSKIEELGGTCEIVK